MEYVVRALDSDIICWMRSKYVRPVGQVFIHDFTSLNMTRDELDGYRHEFVKFGFQEGSRRGNMLYFPSSDPLTLMLSQNRDNKGRFIAPDDLSSTLAKCNEFMRKWDTSNHTQIIEFLTFARFICPPQVMATAHYDDEYVWRILAVLYDEMTQRYGLKYPINNRTQIDAFDEESKRIALQHINFDYTHQRMFENIKQAIIKANECQMRMIMERYEHNECKVRPINREYGSLVMADIMFQWFRLEGAKDIHIFGFDLESVKQLRMYFGITLKREFTTAKIPNPLALGKALVKIVRHPYFNNTPSVKI
eukprot:752353_1